MKHLQNIEHKESDTVTQEDIKMNIVYNFINTNNTTSIYQSYLKSFLVELQHADFKESSLITAKRIL